MPFIPVPNAAQFELRMLQDNQEIENTLWFSSATGWDAASLGSMASALSTWFQSSLLPHISNTVQFVECYGTDMETQTGATATAVPASVATGGLLSPPLPNNVAMCVSFRTAGRGRSSRGRNYVPGMVEDGVNGNAYLPARVQNIVNGYANLPTVASGQSATWVIASRYSNKLPRAIGVVYPVTGILVTDNYVDSQRRRLPGRGR